MPTPSAGFDPVIPLLAAAGLVWGVVADRISARWPAHDDGSVRKVDWRTPAVAVFGAVALAAVGQRFGDPAQRLLFGAFFAACVLIMATDLDQRLMPDVVTLPLIVLAAVALAWGGDSLVNRSPVWMAIVGAVAVPAVLFVASLPFGEGAFGIADVKFLAAVGLLTGLVRVVIAVFAGALVSGFIVIALLVSRRITLRSYIPFGPFLIIGAVWAVLLPAST
jgi:leader peptidase (prepilin peptidase) / N-methyltransferase